MNTIGGKVNDDYGLEITVFHKIRNFSDGVSFFKMKANWDRYIADHSPRVELNVVLFNYTLLSACRRCSFLLIFSVAAFIC